MGPTWAQKTWLPHVSDSMSRGMSPCNDTESAGFVLQVRPDRYLLRLDRDEVVYGEQWKSPVQAQ